MTPHPETGKKLFDLDAAQAFIAQLDMLEAKTQGNLSPDESALLKQSLTTVRMAFVQAVNSGDPSMADAEKASEPAGQPAPVSSGQGAFPSASQASTASQATPGAEAGPAPTAFVALTVKE